MCCHGSWTPQGKKKAAEKCRCHVPSRQIPTGAQQMLTPSSQDEAMRPRPRKLPCPGSSCSAIFTSSGASGVGGWRESPQSSQQSKCKAWAEYREQRHEQVGTSNRVGGSSMGSAEPGGAKSCLGSDLRAALTGFPSPDFAPGQLFIKM